MREIPMFATVSSSVLVLLVSGIAQMPKEPDFSGEWMLVEASGQASDPAPALTVRQAVTRTTRRGEPMAPWFSELGVERHFRTGVESENYKIGLIGGTVSGTGERTTVAVTWEGEGLIIRTGKYSSSPQDPGPYTEHDEVWSFDPSGRLLITITDRSSKAEPATARIIYRRQAVPDPRPITPVALRGEAQTASDLKLDSRIPADDREKYRSIRDAKDWENPYLVVLKDGVAVRAKGYRRTLPVSELRQALVSLPVGAWPYGAVAAVEEMHLRAVDGADDAAIKTNLDEALAVLKALTVRADRWP